MSTLQGCTINQILVLIMTWTILKMCAPPIQAKANQALPKSYMPAYANHSCSLSHATWSFLIWTIVWMSDIMSKDRHTAKFKCLVEQKGRILPSKSIMICCLDIFITSDVNHEEILCKECFNCLKYITKSSIMNTWRPRQSCWHELPNINSDIHKSESVQRICVSTQFTKTQWNHQHNCWRYLSKNMVNFEGFRKMRVYWIKDIITSLNHFSEVEIHVLYAKARRGNIEGCFSCGAFYTEFYWHPSCKYGECSERLYILLLWDVLRSGE